MRICVFGETTSHPVCLKLRSILQGRGDCSEPILLPFAQATARLAQQRPEMIVVVLSPSPKQGLSLIGTVRPLLTCPVLAVGQVNDPHLILRALHEGANHYLDEEEIEQQLAAVFSRLPGNEEHSGQQGGVVPSGRLLCLLGAAGGSGTSTLAVNLAIALAREQSPCCLVDMKPGSGDLAALLDLKPTHTLADLCLNFTRMDRTFFESALVAHSAGVHLLAPPQVFTDLSVVTPNGVSKTLGLARSVFSHTLVDVEDWFHAEQIVALRQADLVLLIFRLEFTSLRNARRALEQLQNLGLKGEQISLVVNRQGQPKELPPEEAEQALEKRIDFFIPDDPRNVNGANNTGVPLVLKSPNTRISQCIQQMARKLIQPKSDHQPNGRGLAWRSVTNWFTTSRGG